MAKTIFEQMGDTYEQQGDYFIPCLALPDEEQIEIGVWGQRHLRYIKQHHKVQYTISKLRICFSACKTDGRA